MRPQQSSWAFATVSLHTASGKETLSSLQFSNNHCRLVVTRLPFSVLHDFDETKNQLKLLRVPIPCDADTPQGLFPAQRMEPHTWNFQVQSGPRNQGDAHSCSNEVEDGQNLICFLDDSGSDSCEETTGQRALMISFGNRRRHKDKAGIHKNIYYLLPAHFVKAPEWLN